MAIVRQPKTFVELNLHALATRQERPYSVWLLARHLDPAGSGRVSVKALRQLVCQQTIGHRQSLWRWLRQGDGTLWTRSGDSLHYRGLLEVGDRWGVNLREHPVYLPIEDFANLGRLRRAFVASFFANKERTISQRKLGELIGRTGRSVARYLRQGRIEKQANLMVSTRPAFRDHLDVDLARDGYFRTKVGDHWILARRLPNTYHADFETAPFGLVRHQHKLLTDQGPMRRCFYRKPKAGARAIEGLQDGERIFVQQEGKTDFWGAQVWQGWSRTLGMTAPC